MSDEEKITWAPLESNPEVWTDYCKKLGLELGTKELPFNFCDVFGLDPELLEMVPKPVLSVILCYPINEKITAYSEQISAAQIERNSAVKADAGSQQSEPWYMKQRVGNACGTIAIMHTLSNVDRNLGGKIKDQTKPGSFFNLLLSNTQRMTPEERAEYMVKGDGAAQQLNEAQETAAEQGDTKAADYQDTHLHFVSFVVHRGRLLELDGRKAVPIDHGACSGPDQILAVAKEAIMKISDMGGAGDFSLVALAGLPQDE